MHSFPLTCTDCGIDVIRACFPSIDTAQMECVVGLYVCVFERVCIRGEFRLTQEEMIASIWFSVSSLRWRAEIDR